MLVLTLVLCGVSQHGQPQCGELELGRAPLAFGLGQLLPPGSRLFFHQQSKRSTRWCLLVLLTEGKPLAASPSWSCTFSQNLKFWYPLPTPPLPPVQVSKAASAICLHKGGQRGAGHKSPGRIAPFQAGVKGKTDTQPGLVGTEGVNSLQAPASFYLK